MLKASHLFFKERAMRRRLQALSATDSLVDVKVDQRAARDVLQRLCEIGGLSYMVQDGRVLLHAKHRRLPETVARLHDIRDLTVKFQDFKGPGIVVAGLPAATIARRPIAVRSWKRSRLPPHTCRVQVGDGKPLPLVSVRAHLSVDGFRARVLLDYVFRNDRNQQLEGTFQLRLPDGASPYFLAFGQTVLQAELPEPTGLSPESILADRKDAWTGKPRVARMVDRRRPTAPRSSGFASRIPATRWRLPLTNRRR